MTGRKDERRKHKRHIVEGVHGSVLYPSDVDIIDISIDGAAIETTKRINVNREYPLRIRYKDTLLNLRGRVVWSILSHSEKTDSGEVIPVYKAGMKFTDIRDERAKMLLEFIEENKTKTYERRLSGVRFKVAASENIKIDYPYRYDVKKISLSGMLVETEYSLDLNSHYNLELFLNENSLNILGRIVNCTKGDSDNVTKYNVGIEFVEMSDNDRELLKDFVDTLEEDL
ncbi:MAG: PilZ domain-containing protein [Nitrospirota bacterium]